MGQNSQNQFQNDFPTRWQQVLFRNYGKVPARILARLLGMDTQTLTEEAKKMGLGGVSEDETWIRKGYVTIIRSNWDLLPESAIAQLLGTDEGSYRMILREDDFLSVKLGKKIRCTVPVYAPLTEEQEQETRRIGTFVKGVYCPKQVQPFDFYAHSGPCSPLSASETGERVIYSYSSLFGNLLDSGDFSSYSDDYLKRLRDRGITGVWIYGQLQKLSPCPFNEELSRGYEKRRKNLALLTAWCKKYKIGLYLYLNEPRAVPASKLSDAFYGQEKDGCAALCMRKSASQEYLEEAVRSLLVAVPELRGVITITMSENYTHCFSRGKTHCERCKDCCPQDIAATVNNLIYRGVKKSGSSARVIANLWGWSPFMNWDEQMLWEGIDRMEKGIEVMCVSEYGKKFSVCGVESEVIDYSVSHPGPSEISRKTWEYARKKGHKVWAKIQLNNSWECSAVPFIPVFPLQAEHLNALSSLHIENYMLSWTLGGYPSPLLSLVNFCKGGKCDLEGWLKAECGEEAERIRAATEQFAAAFRNYPFSVEVLYKSPVTIGPGLLWQKRSVPLSPGMVCFPYDAVEEYSAPYGAERYALLMDKLAEEWGEGIKLLPQKESSRFKQLYRCAVACQSHFLSAALYTRFVLHKQRGFADRKAVLDLLEREYKNVLRLYRLTSEDASIGFEASNHYFYDENILLEKLIRLKGLADCFEKQACD